MVAAPHREPASDNLQTLTDKEKETLRLIVRGHDAKSAARELDLSVHTVNERLRGARRKLGVTSSKEAARLLLEWESDTPQSLGYTSLGGDAEAHSPDTQTIPQPARRWAILTGGIVLMLALTLAAAFALSWHPANDRPAGDPATAMESLQIETFEATARDWLALVDAGDWEASFAAAGRTFRDPNTVAVWRFASEQARVPLGAMIERSAQTVELAQSDYTDPESKDSAIVRFATRFENREEAIETVTLEQEHGEWKVVGYLID